MKYKFRTRKNIGAGGKWVGQMLTYEKQVSKYPEHPRIKSGIGPRVFVFWGERNPCIRWPVEFQIRRADFTKTVVFPKRRKRKT